VRLARRDAELARALPVLLHRRRSVLPAIVRRAVDERVGHHLGFFLAVTASLTDDTDMQQLAATLRDRRVKRQDFFLSSRAGEIDVPLLVECVEVLFGELAAATARAWLRH